VLWNVKTDGKHGKKGVHKSYKNLPKY